MLMKRTIHLLFGMLLLGISVQAQENWIDSEAWTMEVTAYGNQTTADVREIWTNSSTAAFKNYQTITALPSGRYLLSVQAMYRSSLTDPEAATNVVLYATVGDTEYSVDVCNFAAVSGTTESLTGLTVAMDADANNYLNQVYVTVPEAQDVTVGMRSIGSLPYCTNGYWLVWKLSSFQLVDANSYYSELLNELILIAEDIMSKVPGATSLSSLIDAATDATDDVAMQAAAEDLQVAIDGFATHLELYDLLQEAETKYDEAAVDAAVLQAAITSANAALNSASVDGATTALSNLQTALRTYDLSNASSENPVDVTYLLINPELYTTSEGWSGSTPAFEYNVAEFYQTVFDMYQTVTVPVKGKYVLSVSGFHRAGANDAGAAYAAGTENIQAVLYANKSEASFLSLYAHTASEMELTSSSITSDYVNMRVAADEAFTKGYYYENAVSAIVPQGESLTVGIKLETSSSYYWTAFRDFKLMFYGYDLNSSLEELQQQVLDFEDANYDNVLPGIFLELEDALQASYDANGNPDNDVIAAAIEALSEVLNNTKKSISLTAELYGILQEVEDYLNSTEYPGYDILAEQYDAAYDLTESEGATYQDLVNTMAVLDKAIINYIFSQECSTDSPSNVTIMIQHPSFREDGYENTAEATFSSTGWVNGNVYTNQDAWAGFRQLSSCWNSWSSDFTSMNVYQDIENLPAGIYSLSCAAITPDGSITSQHAYITSDITTAVSPTMTIGGWNSDPDDSNGPGVWETLQTAKVKLNEGATLRIGFASTSGGGTAGWFCVTDFQLFYHGTDDAELLEQSIALLNELRGKMTLQGDVAKVDDYIALARSASNDVEAYGYLDKANEIANTSISAYTSFVDGYYLTLAESITDATPQELGEVVATALDGADARLTEKDATYQVLDEINLALRYYIDYIAIYTNAVEMLKDATLYVESYVTDVKDLMTVQTTTLKANLVDASTIADYGTLLNRAVENMKVSEVFVDTKAENDLTYKIINQAIEAADNNSDVNGWTLSMVDGNTYTSDLGQYFTGDTEKRYFDSWNGTAGLLKYTGYQLITEIPNGTYTMRCVGRASGKGTFIFAATSDTLWLEMPLCTHVTETEDIETGTITLDTVIVTDTYGPIWEEAEEGTPEKECNGGIGRGWQRLEITGIPVTNHQMSIGFSSDKAVTHVTYEGTWFSVTDYEIYLTALGDNSDWIIGSKVQQTLAGGEVVAISYYNMNGIQTSEPVKGINIVKTKYADGSVKVAKMFVK